MSTPKIIGIDRGSEEGDRGCYVQAEKLPNGVIRIIRILHTIRGGKNPS